jgi:hypothetical protein
VHYPRFRAYVTISFQADLIWCDGTFKELFNPHPLEFCAALEYVVHRNLLESTGDEVILKQYYSDLDKSPNIVISPICFHTYRWYNVKCNSSSEENILGIYKPVEVLIYT